MKKILYLVLVCMAFACNTTPTTTEEKEVATGRNKGFETITEDSVVFVCELYPHSMVVEYLPSEQGPGIDRPFPVERSTHKQYERGDTLLVYSQLLWNGNWLTTEKSQ